VKAKQAAEMAEFLSHRQKHRQRMLERSHISHGPKPRGVNITTHEVPRFIDQGAVNASMFNKKDVEESTRDYRFLGPLLP
jgi:hypothetical protein